MKKLLALLLTLAMVLALSACGGEDEVRGEITSNPSTNSSEGNDNTTEEKFTFGTTNGGTYTNDYLGITCTLPAGWEFFSQEQILALNNLTADNLGEDYAEALEKASVIHDMYAQNAAGGCNLTMALEKGSVLEVAKANLEELAKSQINELKSAYETMGYTDIVANYQKLTIDGKEFDAIKFQAKIQGIDFYSYVFLFKKGSYIASVCFGSLNDDKSSEIVSFFEFK